MGDQSKAEVQNILQAARQMLDLAQLGRRDFFAGGERRVSGLFNSVTSGRSVTFVLQKLRGRTDGFDDWYAGVQSRLKNDAVAKWFVELRNRIEKEGTEGPSSSSTYIRYMDVSTMMRSAPPNATGMFLGDRLGRSGWNVQLADGTESVVFFSLPEHVGYTSLHVHDAPDGKSIEDLLPMWLEDLDGIVAEAEMLFDGASS